MSTLVDKDNIINIMESVDSNSNIITEIANDVISQHLCDLQSIMVNLNNEITSGDFIPTNTLEKYYLELNGCLYFCGEEMEKLGIRSDISKALARQKYNTVYLDSRVKASDGKNKTTAAELASISEEASKEENTVNMIFDRVYKILKYKIDSAYEMLNTLRKVISKRMQDSQLSNTSSSDDLKKQALFERAF